MKNSTYKKELYNLQVELVKFQHYVIENNLKVCIIFEGRDAAGKDGIIKTYEFPLSEKEKEQFIKSISTLKEATKKALDAIK